MRWKTLVYVAILMLLLAGCGDDSPTKSGEPNASTNSTSPNVDPGDAGMDGSVIDDGGSDEDFGPGESCGDGILNQDETDVDCGGAACEACENTFACEGDDDCVSGYCNPAGVCDVAPLETGRECSDATECASGRCEDFGGTSYCTEACTDTCPGQNLACFEDTCTPEDYCDDPDGDGLGFGPGCDGQPCDRCADDATCSEQDDGSFLCICNDGFSGDGETCDDIDECTTGDANCDANATCTNTAGSFECACEAGYSGDGTSCTDVDECATGQDDCDVNAACTNLVGSFECACEPGFTGDGTTCTDVDECAAGTDNCNDNATCTNISGGFDCACDSGFVGNGFSCTDVDECSDGTANCDPNAVCTNLPGSFSCACPDGFTGDGTSCSDVDECAVNADNCDPNAACSNTIGGFECTCDSGFTGDGTSCTDINECTNGTATCGANAQCANLPGTWSCLCRSGYEGDAFTACTNIDECADGTDVCDENATCNDVPGTYSCTCDTGFDGNGFVCSDVDECAAGTDDCDSNATCSNTTGSFTCTCDAGYVGDGQTCTYPGDTCGLPTTIASLPFSTTGDTSLATAEDDYAYPDNACPGDSTGNGIGQADDVYAFTPATTGEYIARVSALNFGARLYVVTDCADIGTTCLAADFLEDDVELTLTAGTTYYFIIDGGFAGDEGEYTFEVFENYCAADPCASVATCTNELSGAQCTCPSGYNGDGTTCTDIDECSTGAANCDPDATCTNTPGSFTCACDAGFSGDGTTCWDLSAQGESCANPIPITFPNSGYSGDSSNFNNDYSFDDGECPVLAGSSTIGRGDASDDVVYSLTPATTGTYQFDVTADHSTVLYIVTDCSAIGSTCVASGYDSGGSTTNFSYSVTLNAGTTYYVIVDGTFNFSNLAGTYSMIVTQL